MAKKIFNDTDILRLQLSYFYQQDRNIIDANDLRSELKTLENDFKELDNDFENDLLNPSYEFNLINEIYSIPEYRKSYNEEFNKGIDKIINDNYDIVGTSSAGGTKALGIFMLIFGILTIPFFMLIFPIVLIIFGSRKIGDAKSENERNKRRSLINFGIQETKSTKTKDIKQEFLNHMNSIKNLDDKREHFGKFKEVTPFAAHIYAHHTFDELMELPCVKAKKKEIKEIRTNLKNAIKELLEISKTLSDKYENGLKKLDKKLVDKATGNFYFMGNAVILYTDDDIDSIENLLYVYEHDLSTVHNASVYRNDADVEVLKQDFVMETLDDLTYKLEDENIIIQNEEEVYVLNPEKELTKKDSDMLELFLELLDATNSINEFQKILEEE